MEEDLTADLSHYQLPMNVEIPLTHEVPKTTLESLQQVKKEFEMRIHEATENNDTRKKGRYQRQLKQFDTAIKSLKSGKDFNYTDLKVPPGFAQIPLRDGRPVMVSLALPAQPQQQRISPQPQKRAPPPAPKELDGDELINMLETELDMNDDGDDEEDDPEMAQFNQQIKAAQRLVPNIPVPEDDMYEKQMEKIKKQLPKQPKVAEPSLAEIEQTMPKVPELPKLPEPRQPPVIPKPSIQAQKASQKHTKDLSVIIERQRLFKEAALKAKQEGNTQVALVYLRHSKGFDLMIQAAESGLPLDMSNLPVPPQLEKSSKKINSPPSAESVLNKVFASGKSGTDDLDIPIEGSRNDIYKHLLVKLRQQIDIATDNFKHFSKMGDIANANKFKKIAQESIQDLEALKNADKLQEPVPLYHYEKRCYETIDCNSDLTDNDLEITIVRAINLIMPKDYKVDNMNTFVKFEFPYPPDECQSDKTKVQHASCNPEYNQSFKLLINRKQTKFMRLMNRKELKFEIYIKGGFLRSDKLLASCSVKLQALENSSSLHNAYELMEGRRQTGGKLEVKIGIREPLLHKGIQTMEHKWLIIDKFQLTNS